MDDVLINKAAIIERCIKRIRQEYVGHEVEFAIEFSRQDSVILNLQRACEATIDMGMRLVRLKGLGMPQSSREVFVLLQQAGIINADLSKSLQAMVGFRNIAVHDYQAMNLKIVSNLVESKLDDLLLFSKQALQTAG
jgi:uncharacterized protein YutE (UPF0331/DUF86 family)